MNIFIIDFLSFYLDQICLSDTNFKFKLFLLLKISGNEFSEDH